LRCLLLQLLVVLLFNLWSSSSWLTEAYSASSKVVGRVRRQPTTAVVLTKSWQTTSRQPQRQDRLSSFLRIHSCPHPVVLSSKRDNDEDDDNNNQDGRDDDVSWFAQRLNQADPLEIRLDATLVACYVLCRFLVYDITMNDVKAVPGWEIRDWIWLTGTLSSATVLAFYWTCAGLLSRSFETTTTTTTSNSRTLIQVLVNTALCCPTWLATEHLLHFGPADIGGPTLPIAIGTGFFGLASFMTLAKALTK